MTTMTTLTMLALSSLCDSNSLLDGLFLLITQLVVNRDVVILVTVVGGSGIDDEREVWFHFSLEQHAHR